MTSKYRGYGPWRRGRTSISFNNNSASAEEDPVPDDLGTFLFEVAHDEIKADCDDEPCIKNVQVAGSYNWVGNKDEPTIFLPGAPAMWTPPTGTAPQLEEDTGKYFRDVNAAMTPSFPQLAAARAVIEGERSFDTRSAQVFTCASNLTSLFRYLNSEPKTFRIMLDVIGDTVFMTRRELSPREIIEDIYGYGHAMPEAYTTWNESVKGSISHQRILAYDLGDLKCLVRWEPDGYLAARSGADAASAYGLSQDVDDEEDPMTKLLAKIETWSSSPRKLPNSSATLQCMHKGMDIPQHAVFDLKTRTVRKREVDPSTGFEISLWLKQLSLMVHAYHTSGRFHKDDILIKHARPRVMQWERDNAEKIRRFISLLRKIINAAKEQPNARLELYRNGEGPLQFLHPRSEYQGALPVTERAEWLAGGGSKGRKHSKTSESST